MLTRTRAEARARIREYRSRGERIGFVPTMGSLHEGHGSLIRLAHGDGSRTLVSIFVNPLQFGVGEDFDRYPRDLDRDLQMAREAGADLVFAPDVEEMYPLGEPWIVVSPEHAADRLCGRSRPDHFRGVLTVVAKLFGILTPDRAIFGRKDYQQLVLVQRMVRDLEMPTEVVGAPIVREPDGLAMSSRNRYLSPADREAALGLSAALRRCDELFRRGAEDPGLYLAALHKVGGAGVLLDYAEVVDATTLDPVGSVGPGTVCAIAAWAGGTRLIDNIVLGTDTIL